MKKNYFMILVTVFLLSSVQATFADTTGKPAVKPAEKKVYTDAHKEDKLYYYDAISSLNRAKSELGKVSSSFETSERDNAVKTIDEALKQLEATLQKHK